MNEMALLAERVGADIEQVRQGIGSDPRIGFGFLYSGCGYGGSCFPKDVKALIHTGEEAGQRLQVLTAVESANERQKGVLVEKIVRRFGEDLSGRRFALWGLAFKPDTDDMREAPSRVVVEALLARGAAVSAYDPIATHEARKVFGESIDYADSALEAVDGADALVIVTEWKEFRSPDFERLRAVLRERVIFDGRNMYAPDIPAAAGLEYHAIGRRTWSDRTAPVQRESAGVGLSSPKFVRA
jgi:UDPglucose 6-dehydrogenase